MTIPIIRRVLPLVACVASGCTLPTTPQIGALEVGLQVAPAATSQSGEMEVVLSIRNVGSRRVLLTGSSSCPPFGFRIADATAQPLHDPTLTKVCTADLRSWSIPSGETLERSFRWNGSVQGVDGTMRQLEPGEYRLVGMVVSPPDAVVTAPPILVRVVQDGGE